MDPEKLKYIDYTNELLNGSTQLFLKWGYGGPLHNNGCICWTSNKSSIPNAPTYRRSLVYYNQTIPECGHWEERYILGAAGATNYTPMVGVESFAGRRKETFDYTLLFARPTCFVMGILGDTAAKQSNATGSPPVEADLLTATTNRSKINFTSVDADNGTRFVPTTSVYTLVYTDYSTCFVLISRQRKRKECFLWLRTETTEQQHVSTTCNSTFQSKCGGEKEYFFTKDCHNVEQ
ncbi:hypothetical protein MTO96_035286 [Rhipicephalus appendiculatus]